LFSQPFLTKGLHEDVNEELKALDAEGLHVRLAYDGLSMDLDL